MSRPDHPTVSDVLAAAGKVARSHEENDAMHRAAFEDATPEDRGRVDSGDTESGALGSS